MPEMFNIHKDAVPPHLDSVRSWLALAGAVIGIFLSLPSILTFGVYINDLEATHGDFLSREDLTRIRGLAAALAWLPGPFYGLATTTIGPHRLYAIAAFFMQLGLLGTSAADSVGALPMAAAAVLQGLGAGGVYFACLGLIAIWFRRRFRFASALGQTAVGVGMAVFPIARRTGLGIYGVRTTLQGEALIGSLALGFAWIFFVRDAPMEFSNKETDMEMEQYDNSSFDSGGQLDVISEEPDGYAETTGGMRLSRLQSAAGDADSSDLKEEDVTNSYDQRSHAIVTRADVTESADGTDDDSAENATIAKAANNGKTVNGPSENIPTAATVGPDKGPIGKDKTREDTDPDGGELSKETLFGLKGDKSKTSTAGNDDSSFLLEERDGRNPRESTASFDDGVDSAVHDMQDTPPAAENNVTLSPMKEMKSAKRVSDTSLNGLNDKVHEAEEKETNAASMATFDRLSFVAHQSSLDVQPIAEEEIEGSTATTPRDIRSAVAEVEVKKQSQSAQKSTQRSVTFEKLTPIEEQNESDDTVETPGIALTRKLRKAQRREEGIKKKEQRMDREEQRKAEKEKMRIEKQEEKERLVTEKRAEVERKKEEKQAEVNRKNEEIRAREEKKKHEKEQVAEVEAAKKREKRAMNEEKRALIENERAEKKRQEDQRAARKTIVKERKLAEKRAERERKRRLNDARHYRSATILKKRYDRRRASTKSWRGATPDRSGWTLLGQFNFYLTMASAICVSSGSIVLTLLPPYLSATRPDVDTIHLLTLFGITNIFSRIGMTILHASRLGERLGNCAPIGFGITLALCSVTSMLDATLSLYLLYAAVIAFGIAEGSYAVLQLALLQQVLGAQRFVAALSFWSLAVGVGTLITTEVSARAIAIDGAWRNAMFVGIAVFALSLLALVTLDCLEAMREKSVLRREQIVERMRANAARRAIGRLVN